MTHLYSEMLMKPLKLFCWSLFNNLERDSWHTNSVFIWPFHTHLIENNKYWRRLETLAPRCTAGGNVNWSSRCGHGMEAPQKAKHRTSQRSKCLLLRIHVEELKAGAQADARRHMQVCNHTQVCNRTCATIPVCSLIWVQLYKFATICVYTQTRATVQVCDYTHV